MARGVMAVAGRICARANSDVGENRRSANMDYWLSSGWGRTISLFSPIAIYINLSPVAIVSPISWVPDVLRMARLMCFGRA